MTHNGADGRSRLAARPRVALLDLYLPGSAAEADRVRAYAMGANAYLRKPFGFDALVGLARTVARFWANNVTVGPRGPDDIRERVVEGFGPDAAADIYRHLLDRIPDGLPNGTRPRHLRCVLYLAQGDRARLDHFIEVCLGDPRDVILRAEYEPGPGGTLVRVRDFSGPAT